MRPKALLPVVAVLVVGGLVAPIRRASAQAGGPAFEVASIRPNTSGAPGPGGGPAMVLDIRPGGLFRATNATVKDLIRYAFGMRLMATMLPENRLEGGPGWIGTDRFDIDARAETDVAREQIFAMITSLLAERFGLRTHVDQRESDVYALRLARSDGRLGPDLRRAPDDCDEHRPTGPVEAAAELAARFPTSSSVYRERFAGICSTLVILVTETLPRYVQRPVMDETGLTGFWDFAVVHSGAQPGRNADLDGPPSLFAALEEQLGLKLERIQGTVDVLVIDHVEPPTPN